MNSSNAAQAAAANTEQLQKLLQGCLYSMEQCDYLLNEISEESYLVRREDVASIGAHMRHVLDRFQCFFAGLAAGIVDYDERRRDRSLETNLQAAQFAAAGITRRLRELETSATTPLLVRESVHHLNPKVEIGSSVARELMGLITHTTHHLAIIGILARDQGYTLDRNFGKAPSTIVFESS